MNTETLEQTEAEVLSAQGITVTLGGKEYVLEPAMGLATGLVVREAVDPLIEDVKGFMELIKVCVSSGMMKLNTDDLKGFEISMKAFGPREFESFACIAKILFGSELFKYINLAINYFPALKEDKDRLMKDGARTKDFIPILMYMGVFEYGPFVGQLQGLVAHGLAMNAETKSGKN